jgi:hypothetical protein
VVLFPREMQVGDAYYNRQNSKFLQISKIEPVDEEKVKVTHEDLTVTYLMIAVQYNVRPVQRQYNVRYAA